MRFVRFLWGWWGAPAPAVSARGLARLSDSLLYGAVVSDGLAGGATVADALVFGAIGRVE
jgi:hypothetical protein